MTVSFKLHNTDFPPLPFPSASNHVSSVPASLQFIAACKSFPCNITVRSSKSFAIATNTPISSVLTFYKLTLNPSKSAIPDFACNIPIKQNHQSVCKFVKSFELVIVNVNVVSVPVCHPCHIVKPVFHH